MSDRGSTNSWFTKNIISELHFPLNERGSMWKRMADRFIGIPLLYPAALWRKIERATRTAKEIHSIGILCFGAIGDTLLSSSLVCTLHERWPLARITLITSKSNACAVQFVPHVDAAASFAITDVLGIIRFLRKSHFSILVDVNQWARLGALLCAASGAGRTVGFRTTGQHRHTAFDVTVPHRNDCHEVSNFQRLGSEACGNADSGNCPLELMAPSPHLPEWIASFTQGAPIVVCHMWPAGICANLKEWPPEHWATLTGALVDAGFSLLFSGGKNDAPRTTHFIDSLPEELQRSVRSIAGTMSLHAEAALLQNVCALVSVNTGYMHLSALLGVPTVDLHGPTNPQRWGGVGPHVVHLLPDVPQEIPCAYLNLGFEYPRGAKNVLQYLTPQQTLGALRQCGPSFANIPDSPPRPIALRAIRKHLSGAAMKPFDIDTFMHTVRVLAGERLPYSLPALFGLHGEPFVRAAYWKVLKRAADSEGVSAYAPHAQHCFGKMRVLLVLYASSERGLLAESVRKIPALTKRCATKMTSLFRRKPGRDMDAFYSAFEDRFRSDFDTVLEQLQKRYGDKVRDAAPAGGTALDLGCGSGTGLAFLSSLGFQAVGVDSNRLAVAHAQSQNLDAKRDDIFRYLRTIPDNSLDVIIAIHVIEHLPFNRLLDLADEIWRALRPGGLLILETPNTRNLMVSGGDFYRDPTHLRQIFPDTLDFLLERAGFIGSTHFFSAEERPVPAAESLFRDIQDYFSVSRDMAWIGHKTEVNV